MQVNFKLHSQFYLFYFEKPMFDTLVNNDKRKRQFAEQQGLVGLSCTWKAALILLYEIYSRYWQCSIQLWKFLLT